MEQPKRFFQLRGFMRSGTNWIGNLLNLHPHICCTGEYHFDVMDGEFRRLIEKTCSPSSILSQEAIQESVVREYELFLKRLIEIGASLQNKKTPLYSSIELHVRSTVLSWKVLAKFMSPETVAIAWLV